MKINKYYSLILIGVIAVLFSSCSSVESAFDSGRKNSSEEFLVEKKSPLSMPPDFDELPVPQNKNENIQDQSKDIKLLIIENDMENNQTFDVESSDKDFELLILDKIKNN